MRGATPALVLTVALARGSEAFRLHGAHPAGMEGAARCSRARPLRLADDANAPASEGAVPPPAWFQDEPTTAAAAPAASAPAPPPEPQQAPPLPSEPPRQLLTPEDLDNTKWEVKATPREDSFMSGVRDQEFTLLADGSVVWGGSAGGLGTGGRWTLKDGIMEVIRTTPLGLLTGRDYYMANAQALVNGQLQFELKGIIRSYNAVYPVMVIADFTATRRPGRFVRDVDDDDE